MNTVNSSTIALFSNVMEGATFGCVDPRACFPLTNIREIIKSGVIRFKSIFRGLGPSTNGLSQGFVSGSNCSIVIRITSNLKSYLVTYLEKKGLTKDQVEDRIASRADWYGIVDGLQCHTALCELAVEYPDEWENFQWPVLILTGSPSIQVLRQLARHNNARNNKCFYIESVPSDILMGMLKEFERLLSLSNNRSRPSYTEVAAAFDGIVHKKEQVRSKSLAAATIVGKVDKEVIEELSLIMNTEHPDLYADVADSNSDGTTPDNVKIMEQLDCRVCRNFLSINAINRCTTFVNESHFSLSDEKRKTGIYHSKNALHRVAYIYTQERGHLKGLGNGKNGISSTVLANQLAMAKKAATEMSKFDYFLDGTPFPEQLLSLKDSILRSTKFDEKIDSNVGNDDKLLPELQEAYKHEFPLTYHTQVSKFARSCEEREKEKQSNIQDTSEEQPNMCNGVHGPLGNHSPSAEAVAGIVANTEASNQCTADNSNKRQMELNSQLEDEKLIRKRKTEELARKDIFAYNMTWQMYYNIVHHPNDPGMDFILSDPGCLQSDNPATSNISKANFDDHADRCSFAKFCKEVLVPGGYVMLFGTMEDIIAWKKAFKEYSFQVMPWPGAWLASEGLPDRSINMFPQNNLDLYFLAKAPGSHPKGFKCDLESTFESFPGRRRHCCAGSIDISTKKLLRPGSKSPYRTDEKNPNLLRDYIVSFTPVNGRVMDPFGGTMTCGLGSSDCGRIAILIENDEDCFNEALNRLYNFSHLQTNNQSTPSTKLRRTHDAEDISLSRNSTPSTSISLRVTPSQPLRITRSTSKLNNNIQDLNSQKLFSSSSTHSTSDSDRTLPGSDNHVDFSSTFDPGCKVTLLQNNTKVGTATLQEPSNEDEGPFRRSLHLNHLKTWDDHETHYVSVHSIKICDQFKSFKYPYPTVGIEEDESLKTLGDLYSGSFYIWNAYEMTRIEES